MKTADTAKTPNIDKKRRKKGGDCSSNHRVKSETKYTSKETEIEAKTEETNFTLPRDGKYHHAHETPISPLCFQREWRR